MIRKRIQKEIGFFLALLMLSQPIAAFAGETESELWPEGMETQTLDFGGQEAEIYRDSDGRVFFIKGALGDEPISDMDAAARVLDTVSGQLGGDERTLFEPWRSLEDTAGNHYYVFQQMYANTTVSGGAVKIITDAEGGMIGLVSSIETDLPETEASLGISQFEAEDLVLQHAAEEEQDLMILEDRTQKVILPVNLEINMEAEEEKEESRFVWAVYSNNPDESVVNGTDLPYLAHYVTMEGEYLYNLPTISPGDDAAESGFAASYAFEFMEPAEYSGKVTLSDGTEKEITIDLMRDARTGMYYLGNCERRIAVADCYEFLYNKGHVVLEASADNSGWDDTCLLSLYNYCRAYDYYKEIGWEGADGLGTPMLILKDYCDSNHNPIDNAAYAGRYYGWQLFLSSAANDFAQCLDVLGHEFTHCVTAAVMTYNAYMNDYGAINEAISDIQGNLCEMMAEDTEDQEWQLGENGKDTVRSMSDPHRHHQPEYTWDVYYMPKVKIPTMANDRGGVHSNSSLLNNLAYRLCKDGGMTIEDARSFWFAVDSTMVPGTDYQKLSVLLPWVLRNLGMEQYELALMEAIEVTRIDTESLPEEIGQDQALFTLNLPDDEKFTDGNLMFTVVSVNPDKIQAISQEFLKDVLKGEGRYAEAVEELKEQITQAVKDGVSDFFGKESESDGQDQKVFARILAKWLRSYFGDIIYIGNSAAGTDGRTVQIISRPGYVLPLLLRLKMNPASMDIESLALAIYLNGSWMDVCALLPEEAETEAESDQKSGFDLGTLEKVLTPLFSQGNSDSFLLEAGGGESVVIPSDGLENLTVLDQERLEQIGIANLNPTGV